MDVNRTLDSYQQAAVGTAIYPGQGTMQGLIYTTLKLNGEAGEIAEGVGKAIRDDGGVITEERRAKLVLELGDELWYIAAMAKELGVDLSEVAHRNLAKLARRAAQGVLGGSGSDR